MSERRTFLWQQHMRWPEWVRYVSHCGEGRAVPQARLDCLKPEPLGFPVTERCGRAAELPVRSVVLRAGCLPRQGVAFLC